LVGLAHIRTGWEAETLRVEAVRDSASYCPCATEHLLAVHRFPDRPALNILAFERLPNSFEIGAELSNIYDNYGEPAAVTTVRSFWHEADARQVAQSIDVPLKDLSAAGDPVGKNA